MSKLDEANKRIEALQADEVAALARVQRRAAEARALADEIARMSEDVDADAGALAELLARRTVLRGLIDAAATELDDARRRIQHEQQHVAQVQAAARAIRADIAQRVQAIDELRRNYERAKAALERAQLIDGTEAERERLRALIGAEA